MGGLRDRLICASALLVGFTTASFAQQNLPFDGAASLGGQKISVNMGSSINSATLSVSGPNGFNASKYSPNGGGIAINLGEFGNMPDGTYKYTVTAVTGHTIKLATPRLNNGRDNEDLTVERVSTSQSGSFTVKGGEIVQADDIKEEKGE